MPLPRTSNNETSWISFGEKQHRSSHTNKFPYQDSWHFFLLVCEGLTQPGRQAYSRYASEPRRLGAERESANWRVPSKVTSHPNSPRTTGNILLTSCSASFWTRIIVSSKLFRTNVKGECQRKLVRWHEHVPLPVKSFLGKSVTLSRGPDLLKGDLPKTFLAKKIVLNISQLPSKFHYPREHYPRKQREVGVSCNHSLCSEAFSLTLSSCVSYIYSSIFLRPTYLWLRARRKSSATQRMLEETQAPTCLTLPHAIGPWTRGCPSDSIYYSLLACPTRSIYNVTARTYLVSLYASLLWHS